MPEISFENLDKLFRTKANDRTVSEPPTATNPNRTTVAADHLGAEGAQTRPAPIDGAGRLSARNNMRKPYGGHTDDVRTGFVLTSDLWIEEGKAIELHAGPKGVSWTLPLRAQDVEVKAGHARFAQSRGTHGDPKGTFFDFPDCAIQFQAGNILPIHQYENEVSLAYGLSDFYLFFSLLNQPPLIPSGPNEGAHNYIWIFYTSLQFPQVVLRGYFSPEGVSWEDSADNPTTVEWNANFKVHEMTPNIWESQELTDSYMDFMRNTAKTF